MSPREKASIKLYYDICKLYSASNFVVHRQVVCMTSSKQLNVILYTFKYIIHIYLLIALKRRFTTGVLLPKTHTFSTHPPVAQQECRDEVHAPWEKF